MNKNSTVKEAAAAGSFEWNDKVFYKYEITFENGDRGTYNTIKPEQSRFVVGTATEYEFTPGDFPKVKPIYQQPNQSSTYQSTASESFGNNNERGTQILRQSCLKSAVETVGKNDPALIVKTALFYSKWVQTGDIITPSSNSAATPVRETAMVDTAGDLPF